LTTLDSSQGTLMDKFVILKPFKAYVSTLIVIKFYIKKYENMPTRQILRNLRQIFRAKFSSIHEIGDFGTFFNI